jgi:archaemetzincin
MRSLLFLALTTIAVLAEPAAVEILVQPLEAVPEKRLDVVKKGLEDAFGVSVTIAPNIPLPREAWYAPRSRYRAEKLLDHLKTVAGPRFKIVVGITAKDISTTKGEHEDWGIFGLGEVGGTSCVISTYRLGARGADEEKLQDRLLKIAVHEAGHVMGLDHCLHKGCVMQDAESSILTVDQETGKFCDECKAVTLAWSKLNTR